MRTLIGSMILLLVLLVLLVPKKASAWDLIELGDLTLEHKHFMNADSPYIPGGKASEETNLKMDLVVFDSMFFRNTIHSQTDQSQYRLVGWNWEFGVKPVDWFEVSWWHFSRHQLDSQNPIFTGGWKEDGIAVRFFIYRGKKPSAIW